MSTPVPIPASIQELIDAAPEGVRVSLQQGYRHAYNHALAMLQAVNPPLSDQERSEAEARVKAIEEQIAALREEAQRLQQRVAGARALARRAEAYAEGAIRDELRRLAKLLGVPQPGRSGAGRTGGAPRVWWRRAVVVTADGQEHEVALASAKHPPSRLVSDVLGRPVRDLMKLAADRLGKDAEVSLPEGWRYRGKVPAISVKLMDWGPLDTQVA